MGAIYHYNVDSYTLLFIMIDVISFWVQSSSRFKEKGQPYVFYPLPFVSRLQLTLLNHTRPTRSAPLWALIKTQLSHLSFILPIQDQPFSPNYLLIHPLHTVLFWITAPAGSNAGENVLIKKRDSSLGIVLVQTRVRFGALYSPRYNRPWSVPAEQTLKLSYVAECGKEKCNKFHLNGSTLANTMGLSFTGVGPPVLRGEGGACREQALMRRWALLWKLHPIPATITTTNRDSQLMMQLC